jgi:uncharacterized MAPEG superfamily protein
MTVPFWCLFIVVLIPYVLAGASGYFKAKQLGTVDNKNPRIQSTQLTGAGARAISAQLNAWEAVGVFSAAVFVNHLRADADAGLAANLAIGFVIFRILHAVFYIGDVDKARSVAFLVSIGLAVALFFT